MEIKVNCLAKWQRSAFFFFPPSRWFSMSQGWCHLLPGLSSEKQVAPWLATTAGPAEWSKAGCVFWTPRNLSLKPFFKKVILKTHMYMPELFFIHTFLLEYNIKFTISTFSPVWCQLTINEKRFIIYQNQASISPFPDHWTLKKNQQTWN